MPYSTVQYSTVQYTNSYRYAIMYSNYSTALVNEIAMLVTIVGVHENHSRHNNIKKCRTVKY